MGLSMRKVLIAINNMRIGGAQKSLLSFLQELASSEYAKDYEIHLLVMDPAGEYMQQLPDNVNLITIPELRWMSGRVTTELIRKHFSIRAMLGEISWILRRKLKLFPKSLNTEQKLWKSWKAFVPKLKDNYDFAISYMDGPPNYWLMDKVNSQKKVLWVHSEYQKQKYDPVFDRRFFEKCDAMVTISDDCRNCIVKEFPQLEDKVYVLENITSSPNVVQMSKIYEPPEYAGIESIKILSVGRLNWQKGFDVAIESARLLRGKGEVFQWVVLGEGSERTNLEKRIKEAAVEDCFVLVGAKENPYPYMKACDILVQPSRVEGRSIVLDEVKVFNKPIIATNYTTVHDSIEHGKNGWIVKMTPEALCEGIVRMIHDEKLRQRLVGYLETQPKGNTQELKKYVDLMMN